MYPQCLGGAVITQWNDLPTEIQRALFEHAVSMGEPSHSLALKQQIARFLHKHKERALIPENRRARQTSGRSSERL